MTPGEQLRAWRRAMGLSLERCRDVIGVNHTTLRLAEAGHAVMPHTAAHILAETGIQLPVTERCARPPAIVDEEDESDLRGKHCWHCCGLAHRRPQSKPCRCGEAWAPDIVQHPVPGLSSSASWCGDYADAKEAAE